MTKSLCFDHNSGAPLSGDAPVRGTAKPYARGVRTSSVLVCVSLLLTVACSHPAAREAAPDPTADAAPIVRVRTHRTVGPFEPALLGTNVPAWLGRGLVDDPVLRTRLDALAPTILRMPGGSWSNHYDWLSCERGAPCPWSGVLTPADYADLLAATGAEGMWTVNVNGTAQEAAALVAYFNGNVADDRPLGTDRTGRDWGTVGEWARARAAAGHPDPVPVRWWEIGNEIYAGRGDGDDACVEWAWEESWTCDGTEYVHGDGVHDGFVAFRDAMKAVDPTILVGAVGVENPGEWGDWGYEVLDATSTMDLYIVHDYAFAGAPEVADALQRPPQAWPAITRRAVAPADAAPLLAVTEHNLVAVQDEDDDALMTRGLNALYLADTIGQMALHGVAVANHWNFANGPADNGTDYGLVDVATGHRHPAYFSAVLWRRFGDELLVTESDLDPVVTLSTYAARVEDGGYTVLAVNKTGTEIEATIELERATGRHRVHADVLAFPSPTATELTFNGSSTPSDDLTDPPIELGEAGDRLTHIFAPWSVTLLRFEPIGD